MGFFDIEPTPERAVQHHQGEKRTAAQHMLAAIERVVRLAWAERERGRMRPPALRDEVALRLARAGWTVRLRVKVDSRGTDDGYRGVLDLVAHPPRPESGPESAPLPAPVLVEFDSRTVHRKTLAKLA